MLSRAYASWNSDMLARRFYSPKRQWAWVDSLNEFLDATHDETPLKSVGMSCYFGHGREVIFNPCVTEDCLTFNSSALDARCGEFIRAIGYPLRSLSIFMATKAGNL